MRNGVTDFIAALKRLPGVEEVTLTTNGVRLAELVPALKAAGVDGVNISLDAADPETFQAITGFDQFVIMLQSDGRQQMIYKHAVSTMTPAVPVHLTQG